MSEDDISEASKQGTFDSRRDVTITVIVNKRFVNQHMSQLTCARDIDMWAILSGKAESEAPEKLESCSHGEELCAYLRTHSWLTGTTDQGRSIRRAAIMPPPQAHSGTRDLSSNQTLGGGMQGTQGGRQRSGTFRLLGGGCAHDGALRRHPKVSRKQRESVQNIRTNQSVCFEVRNQLSD